MRYPSSLAFYWGMKTNIEKAREFAKRAHESVPQYRKYTHEPYIVHPAAVAKLVAGVTDDEATICAAWLHDVVEDTPVTLRDIEAEFGKDIAAMVADLTDVSKASDGNRADRKRIDREHTKRASANAKTVKLADLIDNSRSIAKHDPEFAKVYMREKKLLLDVLHEGNATLYAMARDIITRYFAAR